MKTMNIPFSPPDITQAEIDEVVDTLKSGWITTGPKTKKLELNLSEYVGTKRTNCLNSATAALEMALMVLGIGKGDEVIVPAYTYTASASVIAHVGATIIMVDVAKEQYEMDYEKLRDAITAKTKAVIPVDLAGTPCCYDKIFEVVESKKDLFVPANDIQKGIGRVAVIADAAHAIGATYKGKKVGAIADMTAFSFHAVKNLTTGEGGALTFSSQGYIGNHNDELYSLVNMLSLHGQTKDALAKMNKGSWEYDIVTTGYKCNMTDILASIGLVQLNRYEGLMKRRAEIAEIYDKGLKELSLLKRPFKTDEYKSSYHLYIVRVPQITEEQRNNIILKMADKNIATNVHYKPLPLLSAYKNLGFKMEDYPNAFALYKNTITLPFYSTMTDEEANYVVEMLKECIDDEL